MIFGAKIRRALALRMAYLCCAIICALFVAQLTHAQNAEDDKGLLTSFVEEQLSTAAQSVDIQGFEGALSTRATIEKLSVSDREGAWLVMHDIVLDWDRTALVYHQELIIQELSAAHIELRRRPAPDPTPLAQTQPLQIPEIPIALQIEKFDLPKVTLGPSWIGRPLSLRVHGSANIDGQDLAAELDLSRLDGIRGNLHANVTHDRQEGADERSLRLDLRLDEPEDGVLAELLGLPGQPPLTMAMQGQGPLDAFRANITIGLSGQNRIIGQVLLRNEGQNHQFGIDIAGDFRPFMPENTRAFFGPASTLGLTLAREGGPGNRIFALNDLRINTADASLSGTAKLNNDFWPLAFDMAGVIEGPSERVVLPLPGPETSLERSELHMTFDAAQDSRWYGTYVLTALERDGMTLETVNLDLSGDITLPDAQTPGAWRLDGQYHVEGLRLTDALFEGGFETGFAGSVSASGQSDQASTIQKLSLDGPDLNAEISGTIGRFAENFQTHLTGDVTARNLAPLSLITGRELHGQGRVRAQVHYNPILRDFAVNMRGTTHDLSINAPRLDPLLAGDGTIALRADRNQTGTRLRQFDLFTRAARVTAQADLTNENASADFNIDIPDSALISEDFYGPLSATGIVSRRDGGVSVIEANATLPAARAKLVADIAPARENYAGRLSIDFTADDLAPYSEITGRDLGGAIDMDLNGDGQLGKGTFSLALAANGQDLKLGQTQTDALLAGESSLQGHIARTETGALILEALDIFTDHMTAAATARISATGHSAEIEAHVPNTEILAPSLEGELAFKLASLQDTEGVHTVDLHVNAPHADFQGHGKRIKHQDFEVNFSANIADLSPYGPVLRRDLGGAVTVGGHGSIDPDNLAGRFEITAEGDDIAPGGVADKLFSGQSTLQVTARRNARGDIFVSDAKLTAPRARAQVEGALRGGALEGQASASLDNLNLLVAGLNGPLELKIDATPDDAASNLRFRGTAPGASLRGQARVDMRDFTSRFSTQTQVRDLRPWAALTGQSLSGQAAIDLSGTATLNGALDSQMRIRNLQLGGLPDIAQRILTGNGSLDARIIRTTSGNLRIDDMRLRFPHLSAEATLRQTAGGIRIDQILGRLDDLGLVSDSLEGPVQISGEAQSGINSAINLMATAPNGLNITASGLIAPAPNLRITGQAPLSMANETVAPAALNGQAVLALLWRGNGLNGVSGTISTTGSRIALPERNTSLNNLEGQITLTGPRAQINMQATDAGGGDLALTGTVLLAERLPANLQITLDNVLLRNPLLYRTRVRGVLALEGPLRGGGALISGDITLPRTEITVPSRGIGGLSPLPEVQHLQPPKAVLQSLERAGLTRAGIDKRRGGDASTGTGARAPISFPLDITVQAPGRVFIRGRGIDAELGGSFTLGGTTRNITPAGRLELIRGRVDILQQRFELTDGYGALEGDFTPYISLSATTERDEISTIIAIEGDLTEPEIRFSSSPELPEDEVLSRLVFGQNIEQVSPLQAIQLASAINTLSGGADIGLSNRVRTGLGLDDLDVTVDEEGVAQIRAGKYLNDDTYADVTLNNEGDAEVNINLNLTNELTLKGSSSTDGESALGLFFERDY